MAKLAIFVLLAQDLACENSRIPLEDLGRGKETIPSENGGGAGDLPTSDNPRQDYQQQKEVGCQETLSCVWPGETLSLGGSSAAAYYKPYDYQKGYPWIDVHHGALQHYSQGDRIFFYACEFADPAGVAAQAVPASGAAPIPLSVYLYHPNLNLKIGKAKAVIDFPARPDILVGIYSLEVSSGTQSATPLSLSVVPPHPLQSFVLPVPLIASPGDTIQVYYVNYPLHSMIPAVLYSADPPGVFLEYPEMVPRLGWSVSIDQSQLVNGTPAPAPTGWGVAPLTFPSTATVNTYAIAVRPHQGHALLWIQ